MRYWLVAGLHTEKLASNLAESLGRLCSCGLSAEPLIVERGTGRGCFPGALSVGAPGVVPFLTAAWERLKKVAEPGDWFVRVDADDWYGETYLPRVDTARKEGHEATSITSPYLVTEQGQLFWCKSQRTSPGGFGGTLAGAIDDCPPFRESGKAWGEDGIWAEDVVRKGLSLVDRSSQGYAWRRLPEHEHTFPLTGNHVLNLYPWKAYDLGTFSKEKAEQEPRELGEPLPPDLSAASEILRLGIF